MRVELVEMGHVLVRGWVVGWMVELEVEKKSLSNLKDDDSQSEQHFTHTGLRAENRHWWS